MLSLILLARHQPAALKAKVRDGAVRAGVEIAFEELGDLVVGGHKAEGDVVCALQLHVEAGDGEVRGWWRRALGDWQRLRVDVDLDVEGGIFDGDVERGLEGRLGPDEPRDNTGQQILRVDDGDRAQVAFGRGTPEVVAPVAAGSWWRWRLQAGCRP